VKLQFPENWPNTKESRSSVRDDVCSRTSNADSVLGYTDLPSRLPTQSSTLYSNNVTKFLLSLTPKDKKDKYYDVDLTDEVTRGAIVTYNGQILPPAPRPAPPPVQAKPAPSPVDQAANTVALTPWQSQTRQVATVTAGMTAALALGKLTGPIFMGNAFTFALASLIGYRVVWGVAPALVRDPFITSIVRPKH
jgi:NAD(P) transhydrogenase